MAIAYVEHPVTKQEKKEYQRKGFKIIDARFKPDELENGDKVFMKPKPKPKKEPKQKADENKKPDDVGEQEPEEKQEGE